MVPYASTAYEPPPEFELDLARLLLVVVGWALIALGLSVVLLITISIPLTILIAPVALVVIAVAWQRHRRMQQYMMLATLAVAAERGMPLAPSVQAFAEERRGRMRHRAARLTELLRAGVPLPGALERVPGVIPYEALPTIRVGHATGSLAAALRTALDSRGANEWLWQQAAAKVFYVCFLIFFGTCIATYMLYKLVPEFQVILAEFDAEPPALTQRVIGVMAFCGNSMPGLLLGEGVRLLVLVILFYSVLRYIGWVRWNPPGVARLMRRLDVAAILGTLGLVAQRGRPFTEGIAALAVSYPDGWVRQRLSAVLLDLESGADWCDSLARHGVIRGADLAVLQAAQRVGNLPWALREMADSNRRRLVYQLQGLLHVLYPLAILALGVTIMAFVVAFFLPIVALIENLVETLF